MNLNDIARLTQEDGEAWGYPHVLRLIGLVDEIGAGVAYDREAFLHAAHLHDWGAFPKFAQLMEHFLNLFLEESRGVF